MISLSTEPTQQLFAWPTAGWIALLGLAVWALTRVCVRRAHTLLRDHLGAQTADLPDVQAALRARRKLGTRTALGIGAASLALMQPLLGSYEEHTEERGVDVILALDVSRSMLARDVLPSRLQRARSAIRDLLARGARNDRFGLVIFAGHARLAIPRTRDITSFENMLDTLARTEAIREGGTNLGAAIETSLDALGEDAGRHAAILILTDGEDHGGRGKDAAKRCLDSGVVVHCIGIGSTRGSKIALPATDSDVLSSGRESFLLDEQGREVKTAMDPASLRAIAEATGGSFLDASRIARPLVTLYDRRIIPMATRAFAAQSQRRAHNRYQWPLLVAILCWVWPTRLRVRKRGVS